MRQLFNIPKHNFKTASHYAKFALTWRVSLMFLVVVGAPTIITLIENEPFFSHYASAWVIILLGLIFLIYSNNYRIVSIFISLGVTAVITTSIYFVREEAHVIAILWMIVIILFSFFTLGKRWATLFIILEIVIFVTYFNTFFYEDMASLSNVSPGIHWIMSVEFVFALFLIGYITQQFRSVNENTDKMKDEAFEALNKEKEVIKRQNAEKTVLLQEIHHRVKNNLQVIVSLLRTQANELKSDEAKKSFDEAVNRVMTMALIHQKMYETDDLNNLNIKDYFQTLINEIIASSGSQAHVSFNLKLEIERFNLETIVPLALIINELVSNSLKHAFNNGKGKITLNISPLGHESFSLKYSDNGNWKKASKNSFGLQLIEVFTEQLDGSYERKIDKKGTHYHFKLKGEKI